MQKWNLDNGAKEKEVSLNYQVSFVCIILNVDKIIVIIYPHFFSQNETSKSFNFCDRFSLRFNIFIQ